ncbi:IucA/IucC family C-terminal-domain containing protein [Psychrobacillus glaciei]|uniref:IucA/IucC family C-terminal-domain containing protein n=1 Tax=Psychrobacillus glaciei TaxID=2283160 RepID=UPI001CEF8978|nr:IucA/IucC family C-terminal-domain containing protein [Psychrobacillus glaciei]
MDLKMDQLRSLRLTTERMHSELSIETTLLLDEQHLKEYVDTIRQRIGAANEKVAASLFMKRYAFLPAIYLYAMTSWNERLNVSYENVSIETDNSKEIWLPNFHFHNLETEISRSNREKWRTTCIESLFKEHVSPIIELLSHITKVSKLILWENVVVYISWLYEKVLLEDRNSKEIVSRAKEDFHFIISHAPGNLFGDYGVNPISRFYKEDIDYDSRRRSTCCYSHLTTNKQYCSTCPHFCKRRA